MQDEEFEGREEGQRHEAQRMSEQEMQQGGQGAAGEEIQRPRMLRSLEEPTRAEREEHRKFHIPLRTWCRMCIQSRGRDRPHQKQQRGEMGAPIRGADFFFLGSDEADGTVPAVAMRDYVTKALFAYVVPQKGVELEWAAQQIANDIDKMGYDRVILRCDQEPAMKAFVEKVRELRGPNTLIE